ncbi:MAG: ATP-binding protein [Oscillospiraceae bacterium]|nr:ATP-binding protein [Oscillospiraceae bacterium]
MQITSGVLAVPIKAVVYGPEGIGKSTFAAQAPEPLFIDTEGSTARMNVRRLPAPASFTMIQEEISYVIANPSVCKTLVLDTADWAERLCREGVCAKNSKAGLEDFGYGKGYSYVFEDFGRMLNLLDQVIDRGINVIITAHAAMRKFEQPDESGAYDRWELKLINAQKCSVANMLKEWADMVLFANYETFVVKNEDKKNKVTGGKRVMYTTHHPCWDAKNRFGLPDKLPFEFSQIAHCFNTAPTVTVPPVVSPPPVQQNEANPPMGGSSLPETTQNSHSDNYCIPPALRQLMEQNNVTEAQIRKVVANRGYYPESTSIQKYDPAFVSGVLVGAWPQVYQMIKESN